MKSDQSSDNGTKQSGSNSDNNSAENNASQRAPRFLEGNRQVSLAALREHIEAQFIEETRQRPELLVHVEEPLRHELIHDIVDYVLATSSISLSRTDKLALLDASYHDLFGFGTLDTYLNDEQVTELTIDGPEQVYVRYHAEDMRSVESPFEESAHLERVVQRVLLSSAGTQITDSEPVLEVGALLSKRPARLTIIAPPLSPLLHVNIRLHSVQEATLDSCIAAGLLDGKAAALLRAIIAAGHGLMLVGDVGTGKTTLLEALLPLLPSTSIVVERAQELRIPASLSAQIAAIPGDSDQNPGDFAAQIERALELQPPALALDELRFDETTAMWHAITSDNKPRCLWVFRGATEALRLRTAFGMSVRRAVPGIDQTVIHSALLDRLPFVAMLARQDQRIKLLNISEWQPDEANPETLVLRELWPSDSGKPLHVVGQ